MSLSRFLFTGTFMCPRCSAPCFSNCCGIATTTQIVSGDGPTLPDCQPKKKRKYAYYKSKTDPGVNATADVSKEGNVMPDVVTAEFSAEPQAIELSYEHGMGEGVVTDGSQGPSDIASFLSRPILIHRFTWEVGNAAAPAPHKIYPWRLYLTNARVREKLATFKLFRGTLKVRIFVNGSPFHFGRILVGMSPGKGNSTNNTSPLMPDDATAVQNYLGSLGFISWQANRAFFSQRPHVLVNPNTNTPAEITWPFFKSTPYLDLTDLTNETGRLGQLEIWQLNLLQQASESASGDIEVTFFAWLEDVELTGATPFSTATMRKSRSKKKDEYDGNGVVSMPATALANFASRFTDYSFIGPYARATEIGATAVSSIAKIFGFSKPAILEKECYFAHWQAGRMANTIGSSPVVRLTFDPKQELSVDPGLLDLPRRDEMSFSYVSQIEGLFFQHDIDHAVTGRVLSFSIHPTMGPVIVQTGADSQPYTGLGLLPMGFIAAPFEQWRGSIVIRLQFVCSKMHRGRFALVYTPESAVTMPNTTPAVDFNSHFVQVIDLSQDTDVSYEIKWSQAAMWSQVRGHTQTVARDIDVEDTGVLTTPNVETNGRLDLYVLNNVAIPNGESTFVGLNLYARAGDDFQVAVPESEFQRYSYSVTGLTYPIPDATANTGGIDPAILSNTQEDLSTQTITKIMNPTKSDISSQVLFNTYVGEQVHSIRAVCKRFQAYNVWANVQHLSGGCTVYVSRQKNVPNGRGLGAYGSSNLDFTGLSANFWQTYIRWYIQGYVGWRGSTRWAWTQARSGNVPIYKVNRLPYNIKDDSREVLQYPTTMTDLEVFEAGMGSTDVLATNDGDLTDQRFTCGGQILPAADSGIFLYEVPYYSKYRFAYIHNIDATSNPILSQDTDMFAGHAFGVDYVQGTTFNGLTRAYVATGEDAQFHFFWGCPISYVLTPDDIAALEGPD